MVNGHGPDPEQGPFTFKQAAHALALGQDASTVSARLLNELSKPERLHLLDGDVPFYTGLRGILCDRYNRVPFILGEIPRLGIPGVRFTDGPRGIVMGNSTAFPVSMARGATWDVELERRVGDAIGLEARAQGANYFAGICVNLPRHPAWGRVQETYGEDPLLLGEFGAALTEGVQAHVMGCVKHFALNSMENARFKVDVRVDEDVLHEVYLPHFRRIVEAGVASVMSAYNTVNGEMAGQNKVLLTDILRKGWKFNGFTLSDFIFGLHDASLSVKNGLDIEAPFKQQRAIHLQGALESGQLDWADVDQAAQRILRQQLEFAPTVSRSVPEPSVVFCDEHRALAREVAGRSMVLLKNDRVGDQPVLPLQADRVSKVAIVGRLANIANTGDKGSSQVFPPRVVTPFEGLKATLPGAEVLLDDSDLANGAADVASQADVVICVVGYDDRDEGEYVVPSLQQDPAIEALLPPAESNEDQATLGIIRGDDQENNQGSGIEVGAGGDRKSMRLRPRDVDLIRATRAANPKVIVVVICAGAVIMEEWAPVIPGILVSWYSGSEGGHALADVLLGHVDAAGRLPFSIPKDESHLPYFDIDAPSIVYDRWFGQALIDKIGVEAAFPLGFGLSYTTFSLGNLHVGETTLGTNDESLYVWVTVSNTGPRPGRHVAEIYGYPGMPDFPSRVLMGFAPVELGVGEAKTLRCEASLRPLQRWVSGGFQMPTRNFEIEVASYAGDASGLRTTCRL